jgi:hypothetical protein
MTTNGEPVIISSPKPLTSTSNHNHTSKSIETLLRNRKKEYTIVDNAKKRLTALCWQSFGFPCHVKGDGKREIIPSFASCKHCFETFRYVDGSTTTLNEHQCPKALPKGQKSINENINQFTQRSMLFEKQIKSKKEKIKEICAQWVASSMRPFQIVSDPGFRILVQELLNTGTLLIGPFSRKFV